MNDDPNLPALAPEAGLPVAAAGLPAAMAVMLDERLFARAEAMALKLSKAFGIVPPHLIGHPETCFAVVTRSLTWRLDPFAVAQSTYQTPGGRVGYEGKLCQAILENSGKVVGPIEYEFYGDWSKVQGKFEIKRGDKSGKDYAHRTWTRADAHGLGVVVRATVRGEEKQREWRFDLVQAFPLNSTLWATDPKTQICYAAVRRFGSVAAPGLFMGVPFDRDEFDRAMIDVTPPSRPTRTDFETQTESSPQAEQPTGDQGAEEFVADNGATSSAPAHDADTGEITTQPKVKVTPTEWTDAAIKEIAVIIDREHHKAWRVANLAALNKLAATSQPDWDRLASVLGDRWAQLPAPEENTILGAG